MFSTIHTGLRLLGCGLLLTFVVSIADSLWTGTLSCGRCEAPLHILEEMEFHSIKIRVYECTHCGVQQVEHLRQNGTSWQPGVPAAQAAARSGNGSTAEVAAPVSRHRA